MTATLAGSPRSRPPGVADAVPVPAALLPARRVRGSVKVIVAGGFGAGKSTLVNTVSELAPVTVDVAVTDPAAAVVKPATTSAIDFGRCRLRVAAGGVTVCLFGLPGLARFWPALWPDIAAGAVGAIVVVDPRDVAGCFTSIDHCEQAGLPFVVVLNLVAGAPTYTPAEVRVALRIDEAVPVVSCDVRARRPVATVVANLVEHALAAGHGRASWASTVDVSYPSKENA